MTDTSGFQVIKSRIRGCYGDYLESTETPNQGVVLLNFQVESDGSVNSERIRFSDIRNPKFEHCFLTAVSQARFSKRHKVRHGEDSPWTDGAAPQIAGAMVGWEAPMQLAMVDCKNPKFSSRNFFIPMQNPE